MSVSERIRHELREIGLVSLFFGLWCLFFLSLEKLILAEYEIGVAFVVFAGSAELDRRLGPGGLRGVLFSPPPAPDRDGDEGGEGGERRPGRRRRHERSVIAGGDPKTLLASANQAA